MWTSQREEYPAQFARSRTAAMLCAPHHEGIWKPRDVLVSCPLLRCHPRLRHSLDDWLALHLPGDVPRVTRTPACRNHLDAVSRMVSPPVEVETPLGFGVRLVGALDAVESGLHEGEGVGRRQYPKESLVGRLEMGVRRRRRGVQAVGHVDSCFHPEEVQVRELPREQPGGLKASDNAAFLHETESTLDHTVVLRPVDPGVLVSDFLVGA